MRFQTVDHVPDMEFSFWDETIDLWSRDGVPKELDTHEKRELYFGLERRVKLPLEVNLHPAPGIREAGVRDGFRYYYDEDLVLCRVPSDGSTTMPEHIEFSLKNRHDWENTFRPLLDPDTPGRVPENPGAIAEDLLNKDFVPYLYAGSLFGRIRNFVGFAEICYLIYDDPGLVDDMIRHMAELSCAMLERVLPQVRGKVAIAHFWEDICFNTGPMVSPQWFREHVVPHYRTITDVLRASGVDIIIVDCDGKVEPLVEPWLEAGVNVMFPLERNGGSDPVAFRKRWGRDVLLMGGVDKMKMACGGDDIVRELERLAPLVEEGGFVPHCDHLVPADVSLKNYRFYLRAKRDMFGIPHRAERIRTCPSEE